MPVVANEVYVLRLISEFLTRFFWQHFQCYCKLRERSHERRNELIPVWDSKPAWKQVLFTWSSVPFRLHFKTTQCFDGHVQALHFGQSLHDILSQEIKFHFCQNDRYEIHTSIEFQTHMRIKCNIHNDSAVHFVSVKLCSHKNLMPVWNFISVKMTDMKSIPIWVSFCLNSCEHK